MHIDDELKSIENSLRDIIEYVLKNNFKDDWEKHLGLTQDRINIIRNRMLEETKRLKGIKLDNRFLYYSDFYDLKNIIFKNWNIFKEIFKDKNITEVYLDKLESFRNPNAHRRELLTFQENLLKGIVGELKLKIMNYRGDKENLDTYFPKIESLQINDKIFEKNHTFLEQLYHVNDKMEIRVNCLVPPNMKIQYSMSYNRNYQDSNKFIINFSTKDISKNHTITIFIKSDAKYHSNENGFDDMYQIYVTILPN